MRKYSSNSPHAKARVVAISLLADGALNKAELELLDRYDIIRRLGISHDDFDKVVHDLCDDMLLFAVRSENGELELGHDIINAMLDEIQEPGVQRDLLRMMLDIVHADYRVTSGEAVLTSQAMERWGIDLPELMLLPRQTARPAADGNRL